MDTSLDWRDFEEIKRLRARYFRCVDTHDWAGLRELLDDDLHFYFGHGKVPNYTQADAFVSAVRASAKGGVTVHQGHMPEIEFIDTLNAKGVWAMEDWVDNGTLGFAYRGFGHYHETYRRRAVDQPWLIASSRLTRLPRHERRTERPGRASGESRRVLQRPDRRPRLKNKLSNECRPGATRAAINDWRQGPVGSSR